MRDPATELTHHDEGHGHYTDRPSLHDRLTAAFTGALTEMWQPEVGHSCTGDLPALKDDARVLARVAETVLAAAHAGVDPRTEVEAHWGGDPEQLIDVWERDRARLLVDLDAATHFLIGPYRVARRRDQWEVWPDPSLISLTTLDPPETYPDRDTALARARELAEQ